MEALRAAVTYEPRRAMYARLHWGREVLPLRALRPWSGMGGLPVSYTSGSVVDTARALLEEGLPPRSQRLTAMLQTLQAEPEQALLLARQALAIVVPEDYFSDRDPVPSAPWRVDDGCHRAVCAAIRDPDDHVECLVGRSE